jgi:hypothetical protein
MRLGEGERKDADGPLEIPSRSEQAEGEQGVDLDVGDLSQSSVIA